MKNHAKVGNRRGRPTYRTPARIRVKQVYSKRKVT